MDLSPSSSLPPRAFLKWWIALTLSLGMLSVALSNSAVNIAIPTIMVSLGASLDKIQWVLTGTMITRTVLMPSVGWVGDRIGDRNLFVLSTAIFTAGSFLCSVSWDADSLIFFRIVQAIGSGPLIAVAMSIMFEAFPPRERGLAMGLLMAGWSIGPFFGPILGGYLVQHVNWRAIFYINIPVGLLSIVAAYSVLPRKNPEKAGRPFDLPGFLTLTAGTGLLLLTLSIGQELGWGSRLIVSLFSVSLLLLFLFVIVELRARDPYVELRYFQSLNFTLSNLLMFFRVFGFRGSNFLFSLFLQRSLNYTPVQAGIFHLPGAVVTGIFSPLAGFLSDRLGPRIPIIGGLMILIFTLYGLSTITLWTSMASILFLVGLKSLGQSSMIAPLNAIALGSIPEGKARMGSGIVGLVRGLGEAFGIIALSVLLERGAVLNLTSMTPLQGPHLSGIERYEVLSQIRDLLVRAGEYGIALENKAQSLLSHSLLNEAVTLAYQDLFLLIAAIYLGLIVCVLFLRSGGKNA